MVNGKIGVMYVVKDKKEKHLLFSITKNDFRVDTFRSGGKGGQHQNKTESGVRITHYASGAVGESREERSQLQNKKKAFERLTESDIFQKWLKIEIAKTLGKYVDIEEKVNQMVAEENLKVEYYNPT
jgi:protein subunit release factor B